LRGRLIHGRTNLVTAKANDRDLDFGLAERSCIDHVRVNALFRSVRDGHILGA